MTFGTWLTEQRKHDRDVREVDHHELVRRAGKMSDFAFVALTEANKALEDAFLVIPSMQDPEEVQRAAWEGDRDVFVADIAKALVALGSALAAVCCKEAELGAVYNGLLLNETDLATRPAALTPVVGIPELETAPEPDSES